MQINDELMQKSERTVLGLQQMYLDAGYAPACGGYMRSTATAVLR